MCGVFFCCFHVRSCVACVFQIFSCVFMCGVLFFCCFHVCSCVVCFFHFLSMIFLCVHVRCVFLLFSRGQKTRDSFGGEGQIKFVTNTSPALVTFFSAPPPHSQTKRQMMLQRGGVKFVKNTSPALVTFFSPPPQGMKILLKVWIIMVYLKKRNCNLHFPHPPFRAIKGVVMHTVLRFLQFYLAVLS